MLSSFLNQPNAIHNLTDWNTWQSWTIALVWLAFWLAVWGAVMLFAARAPKHRGTQIAIAIGSLVPAFIWGATTHTVIRHIQSSAGVKWIIFGGVALFAIIGLWALMEDTIGAALSAAGGVLILGYVGISEALTRVASGFPTSVAGLVGGALFVGLAIWAFTRD